jgi:Big-like domain-containing protein
MRLSIGPRGTLLIGLAAGALSTGALPALASADAVPSVVFLSPQAGAAFTGADTITLKVSATDSSGVRVVQVFDGERLLCVDTAAPYACTFTPTASDIGNVTFVAAAINTAGAQALAVRTVQIAPSKPLGLSLYTHVSGGGRAGSKLLSGGTLRLPATDVPSFCGQGAVQIEYIYGHSRLFYLAYVDGQCHFAAPAVRIRGGRPAVKAVLVRARFLGSRSLIGSALLGHLVSLGGHGGRGHDSKRRRVKSKHR